MYLLALAPLLASWVEELNVVVALSSIVAVLFIIVVIQMVFIAILMMKL